MLINYHLQKYIKTEEKEWILLEFSNSNAIVIYTIKVSIRVGAKYSTCTWYLYLSTYLSVLDVLEYLVYENIKVLVLVLVLDQKYLVLSK